jgi:tRNA (cytidine56-2'-O)-methyltransferase
VGVIMEIFRLHHRIRRDPRIDTHLALVARIFGVSKIYYSGDRDKEWEDSISKIVKRFGGNLKLEHVKDDIKFIKNFKGCKVHLTVYGIDFRKKIKDIKKEKKILLIVGGEKVPGEVYDICDCNLSVSNQPHSEIAGIGIFLYELFDGKFKKFKGELEIKECEKGKIVLKSQ